MTLIRIDGRRVVDSKSFHEVLSEAFGFLKSYGKNLDALIDCLTHLDDPAAKMSTLHITAGTVATVVIDHGDAFGGKHAELLGTLANAIAFVNWRRIEKGQPPILALAFHQS